ncbi:MAG: hypothetical protein U0640_00365 [Phycisphaerales bacterium]
MTQAMRRWIYGFVMAAIASPCHALVVQVSGGLTAGPFAAQPVLSAGQSVNIDGIVATAPGISFNSNFSSFCSQVGQGPPDSPPFQELLLTFNGQLQITTPDPVAFSVSLSQDYQLEGSLASGQFGEIYQLTIPSLIVARAWSITRSSVLTTGPATYTRSQEFITGAAPNGYSQNNTNYGPFVTFPMSTFVNITTTYTFSIGEGNSEPTSASVNITDRLFGNIPSPSGASLFLISGWMFAKRRRQSAI